MPTERPRLAIPDLLYPKPKVRVRGRVLAEAVTFAFATGGALGDVLSQTRVGKSDFSPSCFARDLFLDDFVRDFSKVEVAGAARELSVGYLSRVLTHPPTSREVVAFRHEILSEVAQPRWRSAVESAWQRLDLLRGHFESPGFSQRVHPIHRRLEILRVIQGVFTGLADDLAGARSPLTRIHDFVESVRRSAGWNDLCELLDYEENLATVEMSVRVGYDGHLRGFEIVRAHENRSNPLHQSPWGRIYSHLIALLRGYRFREREILGRLVEHVFEGLQEAVLLAFQLLGDLEFYLAVLGLRDRAQRAGLEMCLPHFLETGGGDAETRLARLFNPFLLGEDRPPVPCDIAADVDALVVVTGPNSGGKTRLLQGIALAQLLGQVGSFVPAQRAELAWTNGLFVSLIQEASADQREGRLGTELMRIRRMFEQLSCNSLVILDELCSGTNPSEGEEIFELVVELIAKLEPQAFITTHFLQFAKRLEVEAPVSGMRFLQVQLDERLRPTYQFTAGVAETSLAKQTAQRLGVTREALLELVEDKLQQRADPSAIDSIPVGSPPPPEAAQGERHGID